MTRSPAPSQRTYDGVVSFAFLALILGATGMAMSPVFVRYAAPEVGPFSSAFWRMALAIPALYCWRRLSPGPSAAPVRTGASSGRWWFYPVLAGLAFTGDLFFWHLSILNTTIANATFFATLMPVFVTGISRFVFRQAVENRAIVGVVICLVGGAVLVGKTMSAAPENLWGDIYGVVTAFFFGLYFLAIGRARQDGGGAALVTLTQTSVTAGALLVVSLVHSAVSGVGFAPTSIHGVAALLGLALVSQAAGQGLMTFSLGRLPTVFSSLVIFMESVVAAMMGWILFDEAVTGSQFIGGVLILAGIWVAKPSGK